MENVFIGLIFLGAIVYLGNLVFQNFNPKNKAGCAKGCGSCGAIDFDKIAAKMESQMEVQK
jgi:hypothetical protein